MAILEAVFADKAGQTPQEVERRRRMAQALLEAGSGGPAPSSGLELAGRLAMNLMGQYQAGQAEKQDASNRTSANKALIDAVYGGSPSASAPSFASQAAATAPSAAPTNATPSGVLPASFLAAVDAKEGGGGYDTLFGHAQRGKFAGTNVSAMPIRDVMAFTDPSGSYAQSVKSQIGRVATPVGRHQIVGTTLRNAVSEMGLDPNATFDQATQDSIALHLAKKRVASANTMSGKIAALRSEWEGFKGVPDAQMSKIVSDIEGAPVEVASLDPSSGMQPRTAAEAVTAMGSGGGGPGSLSDEVAAYQQTPEYAARFPGRAVAPSFPGKQADDMAMLAPRNVSANPVPPGSQPLPQGIPAEFAGSQQLANAQGGIIPALMGGTAASPEQVAQARALGAAQPQPQPQGQDNRALIATLLGNPYTAEAGQQLLMQEMQRRQEASDPIRQMQMEEQRLKLNAMRNPPPDYDMITGKDGSIFRADKRTGNIEQVYGGKPDKFRTLTDAEEQQLGLDTSKAYQVGADNKVAQIGGGGTTVNIDQKAEGAFDKKLAEKQAETFDTMATEGLNARADIGIIQELDTLLQGQGGTLSGIAGIAAKYGIGGEGMGDLQAVQALINKLVPTQRAPGSGSMSDRDVELFTRSLPSLWNEPGGNAKILRVMRGLAEYKQAQGEIADQVLTGDMSRQEARRALRALPNPLAQSDTSQDVGKVPEGVDPEDWKALTPEERKLWQ